MKKIKNKINREIEKREYFFILEEKIKIFYTKIKHENGKCF